LAAPGKTDIIINDPREAAQFEAGKQDYRWDYVDPAVIEELKAGAWISFYVQPQESAAELLALLAQNGFSQEDGTLRAARTETDDQDWLHKWEEYFVTARVSRSIVVKPVWHAYEASEGERVIEIDPGMAFGTGTHATTAMCVRLLEKYVKPGCSVLDVGCGSGILSVAAAKLGASDVMAVDLDPLAVESTERNVALNGCADAVAVREGDLTKGLDYRADVVAANLMADLVILLSKDVARHCAPEAVFISSGILDEKEKEVSSAVEEAGFDILEVLHEDGWCAIAGRYKGR
jgi:ribosomal protein L11 methyltransferase